MSLHDVSEESRKALTSSPSNESREFLRKLMGSSVTVEIVDGRTFSGSLLCTDGEANIVMGSCIEYPPPGTYGKDDLSRRLFLITIRGVHIKRIFLNSNLV
uniref:N-alpha-acetyltransferase 38, NatC auxiliary subunit n=1 Tax=Schistocephalus solidus TaxID=70667 RepID=A0A0X3NW00_SCHSO